MLWKVVILVAAGLDALMFLAIVCISIRYRKSAKRMPKDEQPRVGDRVSLSVFMAICCVVISGCLVIPPSIGTRAIVAASLIQVSILALGYLLTFWAEKNLDFDRFYGWMVNYGNVTYIGGLPLHVKLTSRSTVHYVGGLRIRNLVGFNPETGLEIRVIAETLPIPETNIDEYSGLVNSACDELEVSINNLARSISAESRKELMESGYDAILRWADNYKPSQLLTVRFRRPLKADFVGPSPVTIG